MPYLRWKGLNIEGLSTTCEVNKSRFGNTAHLSFTGYLVNYFQVKKGIKLARRVLREISRVLSM